MNSSIPCSESLICSSRCGKWLYYDIGREHHSWKAGSAEHFTGRKADRRRMQPASNWVDEIRFATHVFPSIGRRQLSSSGIRWICLRHMQGSGSITYLEASSVMFQSCSQCGRRTWWWWCGLSLQVKEQIAHDKRHFSVALDILVVVGCLARAIVRAGWSHVSQANGNWLA